MAPLVGSLIVVVMFVADHPGLYPLNRRQTVTLDAAIANLSEGFNTLTDLMGAIRDNLEKRAR